MHKKTVLITGCSSGLGKHMAIRFEEAGWRVIATSRSWTGLGKLDVRDKEDRKKICEYIQNECQGNLDCLVNNAGYALVGNFETLSDEQLRDVVETNAMGAAFLTRDLLPALRKAQGKVINISSTFGSIGFPFNVGYCMSKFAVNGLTEALRLELSPHGIQVSSIHPGAHKTRFGENMVMVNCSSRFLALCDHYRQTGKAAEPDQVAIIAVKLAQKKKMPLRTYVGKDEKLLRYLKAFVPERLFQWGLNKLCLRLFKE
jgi:NAD(P)-dependent dehydrogenase (short-subunit alcohol dehydrogenase family)